MYKSGKNWIVAPLVFLGLVVGVNINNANVSADTTAQSQATDSNQANTNQQEVVKQKLIAQQKLRVKM